MTTTIATVDLKTIHEIYNLIKTDYAEHNERFLYFMATCLQLDPDVNFDIALKLRPYGGIIGIDNSSLDTYLKSSKVLRLHAIFHDASGFIAEYSQKGPGYSYVLPCPSQTLTLVTWQVYSSACSWKLLNVIYSVCWNVEFGDCYYRFWRFSTQKE